MDFDPSKDYYSVLGVGRDADAKAIKAAYHKLAKKHHPDVNGNSDESKKRFQEISEAYEVLSDENRRHNYDAARSYGGSGAWYQTPSSFGDDIFSFGGSFSRAGFRSAGDYFRDMNRVKPNPATQPIEGGDARTTLKTTFAESVVGTKRDVTFVLSEWCEKARSEMAGKFKKCPVCNGTGFRSLRHSSMSMSVVSCEACGGAGWVEIGEWHHHCDDPRCLDGLIGKSCTVSVDIPSGMADGQSMRLAGCGRPGLNGGKRGDLYVTLEVEPCPLFQTRSGLGGMATFTDRPISTLTSLLGGKVDVVTPWGDIVRIDVPKGFSERGRTMPLKGVPSGPNGRRTDLNVSFVYETPVLGAKELDAISGRKSLEKLERSREMHPKRTAYEDAVAKYISEMAEAKARQSGGK